MSFVELERELREIMHDYWNAPAAVDDADLLDALRRAAGAGYQDAVRAYDWHYKNKRLPKIGRVLVVREDGTLDHLQVVSVQMRTAEALDVYVADPSPPHPPVSR